MGKSQLAFFKMERWVKDGLVFLKGAWLRQSVVSRHKNFFIH